MLYVSLSLDALFLAVVSQLKTPSFLLVVVIQLKIPTFLQTCVCHRGKRDTQRLK